MSDGPDSQMQRAIGVIATFLDGGMEALTLRTPALGLNWIAEQVLNNIRQLLALLPR